MRTQRAVLSLIVGGLLLLGVSSASAHDRDCDDHEIRVIYDHDNFWSDGDDIDIDLDDGTVMISHRDRRNGRSEVEINDKYELFVNGKQIELNDSQQELVKKFHGQMMEIKREARALGKEAAKIGLKGAKLGISALGKTVKLISSSYDSDDLEREIEREAEKIEKEAERLEDWAEEIEDLAEETEDTARQMHREIPALAELDWFDR